MKKLTCLAAAMALTLPFTLTACGGGGGGDGSGSNDTPNQNAAGFWSGTGKDGRTVYGLGQANGDYWVLMSAPNDATILAVAEQGHIDTVRGSALESNHTIAVDWVTRYWHGSELARLLATSQSSLTGSINLNILTYALSYQPASGQTSSLVDLAGTYSGRLLSAAEPSHSTLVIDAAGTISGTYVYSFWPGCTYSGSLTPTTQASVYAMTVTFGSGCENAGTATGSLFFDKAHANVYAVALKLVNDNNSGDGVRTFAFVGRPTPL